MAKVEASIDDRIAALHAELDELIEKRVDHEKVPGVPREVIRQMLVARAKGGFCRCAAGKIIRERQDQEARR